MKKPFLYNVVDTLYHGVMDKMPQTLQNKDKASAFILGSVGIYSVVRGLQWTSKNIINKVIPNFDNKYLPTLEKTCIVGMLTIPIVYAAINPKRAEKIKKEHPTYTSGMAGVFIGSITGAVQDLHKRSKQTLDNTL